ncbi:MAG: hypothetical protein ACI9S8_000080 [Chlamydiales bacterium]|jgi:hypothetical protein
MVGNSENILSHEDMSVESRIFPIKEWRGFYLNIINELIIDIRIYLKMGNSTLVIEQKARF